MSNVSHTSDAIFVAAKSKLCLKRLSFRFRLLVNKPYRGRRSGQVVDGGSVTSTFGQTIIVPWSSKIVRYGDAQ